MSEEGTGSEKAKRAPPWMAIISAVAPIITGGGTWMTASNSIDTQVAQLRLEAEKAYAQKASLDALSSTVAQLAIQVAELRGRLLRAENFRERSEASLLRRRRGDDG